MSLPISIHQLAYFAHIGVDFWVAWWIIVLSLPKVVPYARHPLHNISQWRSHDLLLKRCLLLNKYAWVGILLRFIARLHQRDPLGRLPLQLPRDIIKLLLSVHGYAFLHVILWQVVDWVVHGRIIISLSHHGVVYGAQIATWTRYQILLLSVLWRGTTHLIPCHRAVEFLRERSRTELTPTKRTVPILDLLVIKGGLLRHRLTIESWELGLVGLTDDWVIQLTYGWLSEGRSWALRWVHGSLLLVLVMNRVMVKAIDLLHIFVEEEGASESLLSITRLSLSLHLIYL